MKKISNKKLERDFNNNKNVLKYFDKSKKRKINETIKRVNVDFPAWLVDSLDKEARRLGVSRQSVIKVWIAERLAKNEG
jgi:hypothetical protein